MSLLLLISSLCFLSDEKEHHIQLREVNNSTCVHRVGNHEVFKTQPKSVLSEEGSVAFFPCEIQEKSNNYLVPIWRFNGETLHLSSDLPSNYIYNGSGLVVSPVKLDFNGSTYECCTFCRNNSGMLIESNKGMLTVSTKTSHSSHDILSFSVLILTVVIVFLLN